jgi:hypothetical protein
MKLSCTLIRPISLAVVLLMNSCSKEELEVPLPNTVETTSSESRLASGVMPAQNWTIKTNGISADLYSNVNFVGVIGKSGSKKIVEAGFVISYPMSEGGPIDPNPTYDFTLFCSIKKVLLSSNTPIGAQTFKYAPPMNFCEAYYRSYIKLENGSVIQGDVRHYKKPIVNTFRNLELGVGSRFEGTITRTGDAKIVEAGFLYSTLPGENEPYYYSCHENSSWKLGYYAVLKGTDIKIGSFKYDFNDFSKPYTKLYFRSYLKLADGTVTYGNIETYTK